MKNVWGEFTGESWGGAQEIQVPFQDAVICSELAKQPHTCELRIGEVFTYFRMDGARPYAECLIPGDPFVGRVGELEHGAVVLALNEFSQQIGMDLYFPQVYEDSTSANLLLQINAERWPRLSSPGISLGSLKNGLVERASKRIGSQALRRIRKFSEAGATVVRLTGLSAFSHIESIERASWKSKQRQDMFSRRQDALYRALACSRNSLVSVAMLDERPIAYRFDYRTSKIMFAVKWSFSEFHRQISPGFYLLTKDLTDCWGTSDIEFVDLYGSADLLKQSICDFGMDRSRLDIAWPPGGKFIGAIREERLAHDVRLTENFRSGNAIRELY